VADDRVIAGTRAQLEHWREELQAGAGRVGWKIGLNTPAAQERLGISEPAVGHLTSATLLEPGASHPLAGGGNVMVEPEVAIEIGGGGQLAGLGAAIEIVDVDPDDDDLERIVADNIFHRAVVLGASLPGEELPEAEARVIVNGEERSRGPVEVDLAGTLRVVVGLLAELGEGLVPGERIITGSLTAPVPVAPGDAVAVEIGPLGRLEVLFGE
jgi:2-keto-4-pentenoate hydratase